MHLLSDFNAQPCLWHRRTMPVVNVTTDQRLQRSLFAASEAVADRKILIWGLGEKIVFDKNEMLECAPRVMLGAIMSIKGNDCLCPEERVCLCATLNPVLPTPLPLWVALDFHRFHSCSRQCTPLHLKSLKRSEAPKSPSADNSPWVDNLREDQENTATSYSSLWSGASFYWNLPLPWIDNIKSKSQMYTPVKYCRTQNHRW